MSTSTCSQGGPRNTLNASHWEVPAMMAFARCCRKDMRALKQYMFPTKSNFRCPDSHTRCNL
eukprot:13934922-Alexandrium_andersonii.AAC.1